MVDADRTRKHLSGVAPTQPLRDAAFAGHYDRRPPERVYAELLRRAGVVLASRRSAIIDASFREREQREAALELAAAHGVEARFIECVAPADSYALACRSARGPVR